MVKKRTCQSNLTGHKNNPKKLVDAIDPAALKSSGVFDWGIYCESPGAIGFHSW